MRILSMENREVVAITEMSIKDLYHLRYLLDKVPIQCNDSDPEMVAACDYVEFTLMPLLNDVARQYQQHFEVYANELRTGKQSNKR